ncbi:putative LRR receptor-like serine/threonine-protein kinase [Apostasia shenzhenica]|uniref:Putative LRR receptor-like serine/threonine-protein kinase n=1 Tax=Apostasia shenzhenica TaxID=1088818 RepID=A0A2I0AIC3_9ASPA|nr:putative LRR receptor-like serine/threonine-protein kinase [Apostasia shenzhenica]
MERWRIRVDFLVLLLFVSSCRKLGICSSVDDEGRALLRFREGVEEDPYGALSDWGRRGVDHCFWFGVECSENGRAISLNLKDLCLRGKLASELAKLIYLKTIILHNNSFFGRIPREIIELQKLEVLDLGYNNLSGPFPHDLLASASLKILVLRNNRFMNDMSPEPSDPNMLSELHIQNMSCCNGRSIIRNAENVSIRRLLQEIKEHSGKHHKHRRSDTGKIASVPSTYLSPSPSSSPLPMTTKLLSPSMSPFSQSPLPDDPPLPAAAPFGGHVSVGAAIFGLASLSSLYLLCFRTRKVIDVVPWKTESSGKLQKELVTGVPMLMRSELETACENFSNIIDSLPDCTLYKGTLSSGVEMTVTSTMISAANDWSEQSEAMFKQKISVLSKVNHKNFLNLIGFCAGQEPFTRMMVYEYVPNGTLFEHLHIKEAEPLDWATRLRIAMGVAYCLDYMHQLDPPVMPRKLNSSTIYLTEDYAAKVSDLLFWNEENHNLSSAENPDELEPPLLNHEDLIYKFGILLLELISGRVPFSKDDGLLVLWASSHLTGKRPLNGITDQTLKSLREADIVAFCNVIRSCLHPEPRDRPKMADILAQLKQITEMSPDAATAKLSPLWWAELEIIS